MSSINSDFLHEETSPSQLRDRYDLPEVEDPQPMDWEVNPATACAEFVLQSPDTKVDGNKRSFQETFGSTEVESPLQKRHKKSFSYLERYLQNFISVTSDWIDQACDRESVMPYLTKKLGKFIQFCNQFKERVAGEEEQKVREELEQLMRRAKRHVENATIRSINLCNQPYRQNMLFYKAGQASVLEQFLTSELQEEFKIFLSLNCYEDDPLVLQKKFQFFCRLYKETRSDLNWKDFLNTEFSCWFTPSWSKKLFSFMNPIPNIAEIEAKVQDLDLEPLYIKAEAECKKRVFEESYEVLTEVCVTPLQVERLLQALSDESIQALEDESTRYLALWAEKQNERNHVLKLARKIEAAIPVINRLKEFLGQDDIKNVLGFCSKIAFRHVSIEPYIELVTLPHETIANFVKVIRVCEDSTNRALYSLYGGSDDLYLKVSSEFPEFKVTRKTVAILQSLPEEELENVKILFATKVMWSSFMNEEQVAQMVEILHTNELSDLFEMVKVWPESLRTNIFGLGKKERFRNIPMSQYLKLSLHDRYLLAQYALPFDPLDFFYCSEAHGRLAQDIENIPLSTVPIEPLIRYLGSKPFSVIKDWLGGQVQTPEGPQSRLDTLTVHQKKAILRRFTAYEQNAPLPVWRELFKVSVEEGFSLCAKKEQKPKDLSQFARNVGKLVERNMDAHDPLSLLLPLQGNSKTFALDYLSGLLMAGKETTICGIRPFITFGSAEAYSSPCAIQDDPPLHCKYEGKDLTLYPRGLFNDIGFGVPAMTMRRKLLNLEQESPEWLSNFGDASLLGLSSKQREMVFELLRVVENLYARFPQLQPQRRQDGKTFSQVLKERYQLCVEAYFKGDFGTKPFKYDNNNYTHRYAFSFLALLLLALETKISKKEGYIEIDLHSALYKLKELDPKKFSYSQEDNPGIENLTDYAAEYPRHTLSAITPRIPMQITPSMFAEFVDSVQALNQEQFLHLLHSCLSMLQKKLDEAATQLDYFKALKECSDVDISNCASVMAQIAEKYIGVVDGNTLQLEPLHLYHSDENGLFQFCPPTGMPKFIRAADLGKNKSFISALCRTFEPCDTQDQAGSCGVNAFLMGYYGSETYVKGKRDLDHDIHEFRTRIVEYAKGNRTLLAEKFTAEAIDHFITNYAANNEYTDRIVWAIASELYECKVSIYNCDLHGYLFKTNEKCEVIPFDEKNEVFTATPASRTIDLLLWGPHYCYLKRRNDSKA